MNILLHELRQSYAKAAIAYHILGKKITRNRFQYKALNMLSISLLALITGGFVSSTFFPDKVISIIGVAVSTLTFAIKSYTNRFDLKTELNKDNEVLSQIWSIKEAYLALITDIMDGQISLSEARTKRDSLAQLSLKNIAIIQGSGFLGSFKETDRHPEYALSLEDIKLYCPGVLMGEAQNSRPASDQPKKMKKVA